MTNWKNGVYIVTKLMAAFQSKDYQAAGFGGNFAAESGCVPSAVNGKEKSGTFKGSSANGAGYGAGLAQWSNGWKTKIQNRFNNHNPIETWSMDQQLQIVIKECAQSFINLLRGCTSVAQSVDIVLRGYENGSGGYGTSLRSTSSMNAYTWAKDVYVDGMKGVQHFDSGYQGLLVSRVSFANRILREMGSMSQSDLAELGAMGGDYGGGMGAGVSLDPASIQKLIEQYRNAYPQHSEYDTYTGKGGNIFSNAGNNAFSIATTKDTSTLNSKTGVKKNGEVTRTRIYSTNDSTIVLDELALPLEVSNYAAYSNKGITQKDVDDWQRQQNKQKEEAKKQAEEEKKKKEEEAKKTEDEKKKEEDKKKKEEEEKKKKEEEAKKKKK